MITNVMHSSDRDMDRPKTSKHMMERKRRARINDSLLQLKSLIFPAIRKEMSRQPKMEKADILEMTVRYLKEVQTAAQSGRTSPSAHISQYHAGFNECLGEASSFLANCEAVDLDTRLRIMNHLAERCSNLPDPSPASAPATQQQVSYGYHTTTSSQQHHAVSPAVSPVPMATSCSLSTRVPPHGYVSHPMAQQQQSQQQLVLTIPHDFTGQTNPSLLSSQSSMGQSSVLFPTPPPSPVEEATKQFTRVPSHDFKPKAKSALATSYRRHHVGTSHTASQENVWRPW